MDLPRYYFSDEFTEFKPLFERYAFRKATYGERTQIMAYDSSYKIFYIVKGKASVSVGHENGKQHILMFFGPDSVFPLRCENQTYYLESSIMITAVTACTVLELRTASIKDMILEKPELGIACVNHYSRFGNFMFYRTTSFSTEDALTRTCNFLYLYGLFDKECYDKLPFSQMEIAETVGVSRIQISRILADLKRRGIIETNIKYIKIIDHGRLLRLCSNFAKNI